VATVAGVISILIGLFSVFGVPGFAWFREKDYLIVLLVVLAGFMLEALAWITSRIAKLDGYVRGGIAGQIEQARHDIDPRLQKLVGGEIGKFIDRINKLLTENSFELNNVEDFRGFYVKTLRNYPGREFWATSIPSKKFFWRDDEVEEAIAQFIKNGGKMKRIFFVDSDEHLNNPEVQKVLARQDEIKVEVSYVNVNEISPDLAHVFMVEKEGEIAWEVIFRRSDETITSVSVIAGTKHTEKYIRDFEILSPQPCVHRYRRGRRFDPHGSAADTPDLDAFRDFEQSQWEKTAPQYDRYFSQLTCQADSALLAAVDLSPGNTVLDLACGFGHLAAEADRLGAHVIGLDFSAHMLSKAHRDNPNLAFVQGYAEQLPFRDQVFDAVVTDFGMLHLAQPKVCLTETFRVLRKGGHLAFTVWAEPTEHCGLAAILNAIAKYNAPRYTLPSGPRFFDFGAESRARAAVEAAGFEVILTNSFSLIWNLKSKSDFFDAFYGGTARIGGMLRAQTETALAKIKATAMANAEEFVDGNGALHVPMPTLLIGALKPS
jgi:ubiquinone/menaquinone biosynthesis C-methylase UbiE